MRNEWLKRFLLIVLVGCIVGLVIFGVVVKVWNHPGDIPPMSTPTRDVDPPVTRTPRGDEPVPRVEVETAKAVTTNRNGGVIVEELLIGGVPLVALIVALVELAKQTLGMESRYAPALAVGLGMLLAVGVQVSQLFPVFGTWFQVLVLGMVAGLLACGIYSGTKATLGR